MDEYYPLHGDLTLKAAKKAKDELRGRWSPEELLRIQRLLMDGNIHSAGLNVLQQGDSHHLDLRGFNISLPVMDIEADNLDLSYLTLSLAGQFGFVTLRGCRFIEADFHSNLGSCFVDTEFTKAKLQRTHLRGRFERCNFSDSNLSGTLASGTVFIQCHFTNANLKRANLYSCTFDRCQFDGAAFGGGSLYRSRFIGTRPTDLDLGDTILDGVVTESGDRS